MITDDSIAAVVVGGVDFGEADRVVHLITELGRAAVFAHGAKKSKRRFAGALEPFTTIRASLTTSKKKKDALPTLSSAHVVSSRLPLRRDLAVIALASYWTELAWRVTPEGEASDAIFALVEAALDWLMANDATLAARRAFELDLLDELGYTPELERCVVCGERTERPHVDLVHGGVRCELHADGATLTGPKTVVWMKAILSSDAFTADAGLGEAWAARAAAKLTGPMGRFWESLLERPLKATRLLADVEL